MTKQDYVAVAPTVMGTGNFTLKQVEDAIAAIPTKPEPAADPTITKAHVVSIFQTVFSAPSSSQGVARAGGYGSLAKQTGLRPHQVKLIVKELSAMVNIYQSEQE